LTRDFLTRPEEIFWPKEEKLEKFDVFRGNFPNPNHRWLPWSDPSLKKLTRPKVKNFWPGPITVIFISSFLIFLFNSDLGNVTYQSTLFLISHHVYYSNQLGTGTDQKFFNEFTIKIYSKTPCGVQKWWQSFWIPFLSNFFMSTIFENWSFGLWPHSPGRGPEKFQTLPMFRSVIFKGPELKFQPNWIIHHELRAPYYFIAPHPWAWWAKKEQPILAKKYQGIHIWTFLVKEIIKNTK